MKKQYILQVYDYTKILIVISYNINSYNNVRLTERCDIHFLGQLHRHPGNVNQKLVPEHTDRLFSKLSPT